MAKKEQKSNSVTVVKSRRGADIAVFVVVGIAVLILIAVAVLSAVRVNPTDDLEEPSYYRLYTLDGTSASPTNDEQQSKLKLAVRSMDFNIMSAILQSHWDYSYNFKRNSDKEKIELSASDVRAISATSSEYMVELVYPETKNDHGVLDYKTAQSIEVDGETVYFDRVKILIGNTAGKIGTISIYPYIYSRLSNVTDDPEFSSETYKVTGINVRADTTKTYAALGEIATDLARS